MVWILLSVSYFSFFFFMKSAKLARIYLFIIKGEILWIKKAFHHKTGLMMNLKCFWSANEQGKFPFPLYIPFKQRIVFDLQLSCWCELSWRQGKWEAFESCCVRTSFGILCSWIPETWGSLKQGEIHIFLAHSRHQIVFPCPKPSVISASLTALSEGQPAASFTFMSPFPLSHLRECWD